MNRPALIFEQSNDSKAAQPFSTPTTNSSSPSWARFDVALDLGHSRRMVTLDEIAEARWWQIEQAHRMRLEGLVEDIRKTLGGPSSATEKLAWLKELLAV